MSYFAKTNRQNIESIESGSPYVDADKTVFDFILGKKKFENMYTSFAIILL